MRTAPCLTIAAAICVILVPEAMAGMSCVGTLRTYGSYVDPGSESPLNEPIEQHTVTNLNSLSDRGCSFITNTGYNALPNQKLFITANVTPNSSGYSVVNPNGTAVEYPNTSGSTSLPLYWAVINEDPSIPMPVGMKYSVRAATGSTYVVPNGSMFVVPDGMGSASARLTVTTNFTTSTGGTPTVIGQPVVRYDSASAQWRITRSDNTEWPTGSAFNVRIDNSWLHTVASTTDFSPILHAYATNANIKPIVTPNAGMGPWPAAANHPVAAKYKLGRWGLVYQDTAGGAPIALPAGISYNVVLESVTYQTATTPYYNYFYVSDVLANDNPDAVILITENGDGVPNGHCAGVWYDAWSGDWSIFNEDLATMPTGAAYNMKVTTGIVHIADGTTGKFSYIDHPDLNGNPNARLMITQNWNPNGRGYGVYNNSCVGSYYDYGINKWAVYNENGSTIPANAAFNIGYETSEVDTNFSSSAAQISVGGSSLTGNPDALLFATPIYNPNNSYYVADTHAVGVVYDSVTSKWNVFHPDGTNLPVNSSYSVTGH